MFFWCVIWGWFVVCVTVEMVAPPSVVRSPFNNTVSQTNQQTNKTHRAALLPLGPSAAELHHRGRAGLQPQAPRPRPDHFGGMWATVSINSPPSMYCIGPDRQPVCSKMTGNKPPIRRTRSKAVTLPRKRTHIPLYLTTGPGQLRGAGGGRRALPPAAGPPGAFRVFGFCLFVVGG